LPTRRESTTGLPVWVDLASPDPDAAGRFYDDIFGWESLDTAPPEVEIPYRIFSIDGRNVGGLTTWMEGFGGWRIYFSVPDADHCVRAAEKRGAEIVVPSFAVAEHGTAAALRDPQGAGFGLWEPNRSHGIELVEEASTLCWSQLVTHDVEAADAFYTGLLGWESHRRDEGWQFPFLDWRVDGQPAGGVLDTPQVISTASAPQWVPWFWVYDAEATADRVSQLGGSIDSAPQDGARGRRFAALRDPQGAAFGVLDGVGRQ
jgi:predicted enzyme related to lactoylglutathione lyase